jgi:ABC-2 type transport system ATP-binding protein
LGGCFYVQGEGGDVQGAIAIQNLCKTYRGKRGKRVTALADLNLQVEVGQVFGFLGPNGAGKSTTIKLLLDLIRPTSGVCRLFGADSRDPATRQRIGYLPENPSFYDYLSAEEYLSFVGSAFRLDRSIMAARKGEVLKQLGLWDVRKRAIRTYSKGMVQRLGIAQALLHDPDLLIFDEPMSGLDPLGRALVKSVIRELRQLGKTVFFSTHITADVEAVCDRVGILVGGHLRVVTDVNKILTRGLQGYVVEVITDGGAVSIAEVGKDDLQKELNRFWSEGSRIERIEPIRPDMESYFLSVVQQVEAP